MNDIDTKTLTEAYEKIEDRKYLEFFAENFISSDDKNEKSDLKYILEASDLKIWGRFSVYAHGKNWEIDKTPEVLRKNSFFYRKFLYNESPDAVRGAIDGKIYDRNEYADRCIIFTTNINGTGFYYSTVSRIKSHSILFGDIIRKKGIPDDVLFLFGDTFDYRKEMRHDYSGCIFPKHRDLDASYVSIWGDMPNETYMTNLKTFYTFIGVESPIYFEYIKGGIESGNDSTQILLHK